jgi:hypothetical protein
MPFCLRAPPWRSNERPTIIVLGSNVLVFSLDPRIQQKDRPEAVFLSRY